MQIIAKAKRDTNLVSLSTTGPGFSEPIIQNEDNSRYMTASFGPSSTHQPTQGFPEQSSSSSSESESSSESDQDSSDCDREEREETKVNLGMMGRREPSGFSDTMNQRFPELSNNPSFSPEFAVDRVQTSHGRQRGKLGGKRQGTGDLEQVDVYTLISNNIQLKRELDDEAQGFALHLANQKDFDLIKLCIDYTKTQDINTFVKEVSEYVNNHANNFYSDEFSEDELSRLKRENDLGHLDSIFASFGKSGNVGMYKNNLLQAIKKRSGNTIMSTLQSSVRRNIEIPRPTQRRNIINHHSIESIRSIFVLIQNLEFLNLEQKRMVQTLASAHDEKLIAIADVYLTTYDMEDLRENVEILLKASFNGNNGRSHRKSSGQKTLEEMLAIMGREGEITNTEKGKLLALYQHNDPRVLAINDNYRYNHDETEFRESIQLIATAISINHNNQRQVANKRSSRRSISPRELINPKMAESESEEYEEEEEEEEYEEEYDSNDQIEGEEIGVNDENVKNTFIEQQHRIIKKFCLNAKIPITDGAKFHQMIKEYNQKIISAFEVFALNRNEDDFLENLMVIADVTRTPGETESPHGKRMSPMTSEDDTEENEGEEEEQKLFDLEVMQKESESEEAENEESKVLGRNGLSNGHATPKISIQVPYTVDEMNKFKNDLEDFKEDLSQVEYDALRNLVTVQNNQEIVTIMQSMPKATVVSTLETYSFSKDKEEALDTFKLFLELSQR